MEFGDGIFEDDVSDTSTISTCSLSMESFESTSTDINEEWPPFPAQKKTMNLTQLMVNRQIYGKFTKKVKGKTEKLFTDVHYKCRYALSTIITDDYDTSEHIFMGFTACGRYLLSFMATQVHGYQYLYSPFNYPLQEFYLYVWRFTPGLRLNFISKHRIFKHLKKILDKIIFMQAPNDYYRIICYGLSNTDTSIVYISIVTLPCQGSCKHCNTFSRSYDQSVNQGWCERHGYSVHYMFSMSQLLSLFDPQISLAYPDNLIIHTGHHIHILNITTVDSQATQITSHLKNMDLEIELRPTRNGNFNDDLPSVSKDVSSLNRLSPDMSQVIDDGPIALNVYCPSLCYLPCHSRIRNGVLITNQELEYPKWARKIVRKYSKHDSEVGLLLSGQSTDDYNTPVEVPVIIQMPLRLPDEQLNTTPDPKADELNEVQLITTQKTFDCEQFISQVSQKLCADANFKFHHFQKYYIEIFHVCPENHHIVCRAMVEIVTENTPNQRCQFHTANFLFVWNIQRDEFIIEEGAMLSAPTDVAKMRRLDTSTQYKVNPDSVWVLSYDLGRAPKAVLRDRSKYVEVCLEPNEVY